MGNLDANPKLGATQSIQATQEQADADTQYHIVSTNYGGWMTQWGINTIQRQDTTLYHVGLTAGLMQATLIADDHHPASITTITKGFALGGYGFYKGTQGEIAFSLQKVGLIINKM